MPLLLEGGLCAFLFVSSCLGEQDVCSNVLELADQSVYILCFWAFLVFIIFTFLQHWARMSAFFFCASPVRDIKSILSKDVDFLNSGVWRNFGCLG